MLRVHGGRAIETEAREDSVVFREIVIDADQELVIVAVVRTVEAEASGVEPVAHVKIVRIRKLRQQRRHRWIDAQASGVVFRDVEFLRCRTARRQPAEQARLGLWRRHGSVARYLASRSTALVVAENQSLPSRQWTAQRETEQVLVELRPFERHRVVEEIVRVQRPVPEVFERVARPGASAGTCEHLYLGSGIASILGLGFVRHYGDLVDGVAVVRRHGESEVR